MRAAWIFAVSMALVRCDYGNMSHAGSGGTGGDVPDASPDAFTCPAMVAVCPKSSFDICEPGDTLVKCCDGSEVMSVCARPAGILTHDCLGTPCADDVCAVSGMGDVTCCSLGGVTPNPCDTSK